MYQINRFENAIHERNIRQDNLFRIRRSLMNAESRTYKLENARADAKAELDRTAEQRWQIREGLITSLQQTGISQAAADIGVTAYDNSIAEHEKATLEFHKADTAHARAVNRLFTYTEQEQAAERLTAEAEADINRARQRLENSLTAPEQRLADPHLLHLEEQVVTAINMVKAILEQDNISRADILHAVQLREEAEQALEAYITITLEGEPTTEQAEACAMLADTTDADFDVEEQEVA